MLTVIPSKQDKSVDSSKQVKLGFLTGLVPREKSMVFERILFRATRGNVFIRQTVIEEPVIDPNSGDKVVCLFDLESQEFIQPMECWSR